MKRIKVFLFFAVVILSIGCMACGKKKESNVHIHTFEERVWTYDQTFHWHAATCEHKDEVSDKAEHVFGGWMVVVQASYTSTGLEKRYCTVCDYEENRIIPKLGKVENSIEFRSNTKVYDGKPVRFIKGIDYVLAGDYREKEQIKVYLDASKVTEAEEIVNVGTYYIVVTLPETDKYIEYTETFTYTVTKATNEWTITPTIRGWTYLQPSDNPVALASFGTVKFEYINKSDPENRFTEVPTNAGDYQLIVTVEGTENYTGLEQILDFTIEKARNSWIEHPSIGDWSYGETAITPTGKSAYGTVQFSYFLKGEETALSVAPTDAGEYVLKVMVFGGDNYYDLSSTLNFEIFKADNEWIVSPSIESWEYTGNVECEPEGKAKFGKIKFLYSKVGEWNWTEDAPFNVGEYALKGVVEGDNNYTGIEVIYMFSILKCTPIVTSTPQVIENLVYNQTDQELFINGTAPIAGVFRYHMIGAMISNTKIPTGKKAMVYNYEWKFVPEDLNNYKETDYVSISGEIQKQEISYGTTLFKTYDRTATFTDRIPTSYIVGTIGNISHISTGVFTNDVVNIVLTLTSKNVDASISKYELSGADASNYELSVRPELSISQVLLTSISGTKVYDGTNTITTSALGVQQGVLSGDIVMAQIVMNSKNVGSTPKSVSFVGTDGMNYTVRNVSSDVTASISKKAITNLTLYGQAQGVDEETIILDSTSGVVSGDIVEVLVYSPYATHFGYNGLFNLKLTPPNFSEEDCKIQLVETGDYKNYELVETNGKVGTIRA